MASSPVLMDVSLSGKVAMVTVGNSVLGIKHVVGIVRLMLCCVTGLKVGGAWHHMMLM